MTPSLPPGPRLPAAVQLARWTLRPYELLEECERRYGETFTLRIPGYAPIIVVSAPAAVREVFTASADDVHAGEANRLLEVVLGHHSVILLDGAAHLRERKLMMPPFHGDRMRAYGAIMREVTDQVIDGWPEGTPFPLHPPMQDITLDVILRTVFGVNEGVNQGPRKEHLRGLLVALLASGTSPWFYAASLTLRPDQLRAVLATGIEPLRLGGRQVDISRWVPWREVARTNRAVDEALFTEIARARAATGDRVDVLAMLVAARDEQGAPLSDQHLRDELITLLLAGHETTATSLAWVFRQVLDRPDVLARVRAEVATAAGPDGRLEPERVAALPYLDATIKESLRVCPIIPMLVRKATRALKVGGVTVPAGGVVAPAIYLTHRRRDVWGDPEAFRPERFLERKFDPYELYPFGGGTRRCLGMAFALYEMRIVLAEVLHRATLRLAPGATLRRVRRGVTVAPADGVPVVLEARRPARAPVA
ncbi:MAG TPA: cytochrome P450 [Kofleriaceae bacterium]|nr:cytochrome P450 [Kofleriaceae bacterium]